MVKKVQLPKYQVEFWPYNPHAHDQWADVTRTPHDTLICHRLNKESRLKAIMQISYRIAEVKPPKLDPSGGVMESGVVFVEIQTAPGLFAEGSLEKRKKRFPEFRDALAIIFGMYPPEHENVIRVFAYPASGELKEGEHVPVDCEIDFGRSRREEIRLASEHERELKTNWPRIKAAKLTLMQIFRPNDFKKFERRRRAYESRGGHDVLTPAERSVRGPEDLRALRSVVLNGLGRGTQSFYSLEFVHNEERKKEIEERGRAAGPETRI